MMKNGQSKLLNRSAEKLSVVALLVFNKKTALLPSNLYYKRRAILCVKDGWISGGNHTFHCVGAFFDRTEVTFYEPLKESCAVLKNKKQQCGPINAFLKYLGCPPYHITHGKQEIADTDCCCSTCKYVVKFCVNLNNASAFQTFSIRWCKRKLFANVCSFYISYIILLCK